MWNLRKIQEGKNRTRPNLTITEIISYDIGSTQQELEDGCRKADFVFNLAGVNRPKEIAEFMEGNFGFSSVLLDTLKKYGNKCPVMLSSSSQASLTGRFANSEYGKSKLAGEELFFKYAEDTGAKALVYRFPNLFGKWCKPNYNSVVATFCDAIANDRAYTVTDESTELELLYIDDIIEEMLNALEGKETRCDYDGLKAIVNSDGKFCYVSGSYNVTLGDIIELLKSFKGLSKTITMPDIPKDSFAKKLFSTYLTYLPTGAISYSLDMNVDNRGVFTELIKTKSSGQVSINIARPCITRGEHWHNSKWEIFIVVSGHGLIQERRIGIDPETGTEYPIIEFEVTGEQMRAIQMLPGYTHNIINLSKTENLVTVMWANEQFDENHPDTFYEPVVVNKDSVKRGD